MVVKQLVIAPPSCRAEPHRCCPPRVGPFVETCPTKGRVDPVAALEIGPHPLEKALGVDPAVERL
jgi:hypothetical protein